MSYSFRVKSESGTLTVEPGTNVPDGTWQVSGHDDEHRRDLSVYQTGPDSSLIAQASSSSKKG